MSKKRYSIVISGKIASGKTTLSKMLARRNQWQHLSFRQMLSEDLSSQSQQITRRNLQKRGEYLYKTLGEDGLLQRLLSTASTRQNDICIIDGLRFTEGVQILREIYDERCIIIYLTVDDEIRKRRYEIQAEPSDPPWDTLENGITERYIEEIQSLADIVITSIANVEHLATIVEQYAASRWSNTSKVAYDVESLTSKHSNVLTIGELTEDHYYQIDRIPPNNQFANVLSHIDAFGGHAANAAACFAGLGFKTQLFTQTTKKLLARMTTDLSECGIQLSLVESCLKNHPVCNMFLCCDSSANYYEMSQEYNVKSIPCDFNNFDIVYIAGASEFLRAFLSSLPDRSTKQILFHWNPGYETRFIDEDTIHRMLASVNILSLNTEEMKFLANSQPAQSLLTDKLSMIVETKGEDGVVIYSRDYTAHIPAMNVQLCNSFGAGDYFGASVAAAKWIGLNDFVACRIAVILSSVVLGFIPSHCTTNEMKGALKSLLV